MYILTRLLTTWIIQNMHTIYATFEGVPKHTSAMTNKLRDEELKPLRKRHQLSEVIRGPDGPIDCTAFLP